MSTYIPLTSGERALLVEQLPVEVTADAELVSSLAQRVENYRNRDAVDEDGDRRDVELPEWKEPRLRDLKAAKAALDRVEKTLAKLGTRIVVNALTSAGTTVSEFQTALYCLEFEVSWWMHRRGKRPPGPAPNRERERLEDAVAQDLHGAGIRLSKGRAGVLARTLLAVFGAAGIEAPEQDSLFPSLKRLADYWSPASNRARNEKLARFGILPVESSRKKRKI